MYERLEHCPVCDGSNFKNFIICKDHTVSHESFVIVECQDCNFKFTNPRPQSSSLDKYYQSDNYISHTNTSNNLVNAIYKTVRHFTLRQKLHLINQYKEENTLLDFGCGTGHFLKTCQKKGWDVTGIEPDSKARTIASNTTNAQIHSTLDKLSSSDKYQVITMWHVLEHIPDLNGTIQTLKKHLHKNGTLIVALPNHSSLDCQHYQQFWAAYDVPRHLYHFDKNTIAKIMKKHKLKIFDIKPMFFDSYYVSLLSEKHKHSDSNNSIFSLYSEAIANGRKSNAWAKQNNNNYSSLIYLIKK